MKKILEEFFNVTAYIKYIKVVASFVIISMIIAIAWYAFLKLVSEPPIDTTPVLIMIWSSVAIFILVLFPQITGRIKRLKIKDFEIELQETVVKTAELDYIPVFGDNYILAQKGNFDNLISILKQAVNYPDKPVLLIINTKNDAYISVPMLLIYLLYLEFYSNTVVLFISAHDNITDLSEIKTDYLLGAISGKEVLQIFCKQFQSLNINIGIKSNISQYTREYFDNIYFELRHLLSNNPELLTKNDVKSWFKGKLCKGMIELSNNKDAAKSIYQAILRDDNYILLFENRHFEALLALSIITKNISKKALSNLLDIG